MGLLVGSVNDLRLVAQPAEGLVVVREVRSAPRCVSPGVRFDPADQLVFLRVEQDMTDGDSCRGEATADL